MRKLLPPLLLILTLIAMALLDRLIPLVDLIALPWGLAGIPVVLSGAVLSVIASRLFRTRETNIYTFAKPDKLVTDGPFILSRNPMYLGFVLVCIGAAILFGSLAAFILAALFFLVSDRWYVAFEEAKMREIFGPDYDIYCARVRRWL